MLTLAILTAANNVPNQMMSDLVDSVEDLMGNEFPGRPVVTAKIHDLYELNLLSRWEFMYNLTDAGRKELERLRMIISNILKTNAR